MTFSKWEWCDQFYWHQSTGGLEHFAPVEVFKLFILFSRAAPCTVHYNNWIWIWLGYGSQLLNCGKILFFQKGLQLLYQPKLVIGTPPAIATTRISRSSTSSRRTPKLQTWAFRGSTISPSTVIMPFPTVKSDYSYRIFITSGLNFSLLAPHLSHYLLQTPVQGVYCHLAISR